MSFKYNEFSKGWKSQDLARPNLFSLRMPGILTEEQNFLIKATTLPASTVGVVDVPFMNRKIKLAGDRTFQDWTVTVMCDRDYAVYNTFYHHSNKLQNFGAIGGSDNWKDYSNTMTVHTVDRKGAPKMKYFVNGWASEVGSLDLSWDTNDTVLEFTVNFAVNWAVNGGSQGDLS